MILLLLALATFRATRLVTTDTVPGETINGWVVDRWTADSLPAEFVECPWCVSMWAGAAIVAVTVLLGVSVPAPVLTWLAVSALTGLIAGNLD